MQTAPPQGGGTAWGSRDPSAAGAPQSPAHTAHTCTQPPPSCWGGGPQPCKGAVPGCRHWLGLGGQLAGTPPLPPPAQGSPCSRVANSTMEKRGHPGCGGAVSRQGRGGEHGPPTPCPGAGDGDTLAVGRAPGVPFGHLLSLPGGEGPRHREMLGGLWWWGGAGRPPPHQGMGQWEPPGQSRGSPRHSWLGFCGAGVAQRQPAGVSPTPKPVLGEGGGSSPACTPSP